ncbi:MAG: hypothetical protein NTY22_05110 [Proteobacteria bacterium]|nr:hypothetical protein [Pseudomonadota bacterium]
MKQLLLVVSMLLFTSTFVFAASECSCGKECTKKCVAGKTANCKCEHCGCTKGVDCKCGQK